MCSYTPKYADQLTLKQMHDQQISNQRRTHAYGPLFMLFRSHNRKQHRSVCVFIVCHFLSSLPWRQKSRVSWCNDFIGRFSQETKPRPQKLANIIDRLTPALEMCSFVVASLVDMRLSERYRGVNAAEDV